MGLLGSILIGKKFEVVAKTKTIKELNPKNWCRIVGKMHFLRQATRRGNKKGTAPAPVLAGQARDERKLQFESHCRKFKSFFE